MISGVRLGGCLGTMEVQKARRNSNHGCRELFVASREISTVELKLLIALVNRQNLLKYMTIARINVMSITVRFNNTFRHVLQAHEEQ